MPIILKTEIERTAKTPVTARRARDGGLCGFFAFTFRQNIGYQKCYGKKNITECLFHSECVYHYCNFNICKNSCNYRYTIKSYFSKKFVS